MVEPDVLVWTGIHCVGPLLHLRNHCIAQLSVMEWRRYCAYQWWYWSLVKMVAMYCVKPGHTSQPFWRRLLLSKLQSHWVNTYQFKFGNWSHVKGMECKISQLPSSWSFHWWIYVAQGSPPHPTPQDLHILWFHAIFGKLLQSHMLYVKLQALKW